MVRKTRSLICMMLILSLLAALEAALAETIPAWINSSSAQVYNSAGKLCKLKKGASVEITAMKKGWASFTYKGYTGYTRTKYLTAKQGITGYVKKSVYAYKSASASSKKKYGPLPVGTELKVVGVNGNFYQVTNGKVYAYIAKSAMSKTKPSDTAIMASKVLLVTWSKGSKVLSKGSYAYVYDIMSGSTIRVKRLGGSNHFELEPATTEDTEKMFRMCGGKFSWDSRPVILYASGKYLAGAINTMPHGDQSITDNNYNGQFCLHLVGSKTHGSNAENASHQAAIKLAYKWALAKT